MSNNKRTASAGPTLNGPAKGPNVGGSPGVPNMNSGKAYVEREKKILELFTEHLKDRSGKQAYDQIQDELQRKTQEVEDLKNQQETLRQEYKDKLAEVATKLAAQETLVQNLHASHENRLRELNAKSERDDEQLEELARTRQALQQSRKELNDLNNERDTLEDKCFKLTRKISEAKKKIENLERQCELGKIQLKQLEAELNESRSTSKQLSEDLGALPFDRDSTDENFENLATKFHDLVWDTFRDMKLHFQDHNTGLDLEDVPGVSLSAIPQLSSNSLPARYMRCALVEAIISDTLSAMVFNNSSLCVAKLPSTSRSNNDDDVRADLSPLVEGMETLSKRGYPLEATIIQWQLVRICRGLKSSRKIASRATQTVCNILDPWLQGGEWNGDNNAGYIKTETMRQTFEEKLLGYFTEASHLWQTLQCTKQNARVATGHNDRAGKGRGEWDYSEDSRIEYNEQVPGGGGSSSAVGDQEDDDEPGKQAARRRLSSLTSGGGVYPTTLFPQIQAATDISEDPGDNIIFHGYALFPFQPVFLAAWEEQERQMSSSPPPVTRRNSGFPRRKVSQPKTGRPAAPSLLERQDHRGQLASGHQGQVRDPGLSQQQVETNNLRIAQASNSKSNVGSRRLSTSSRDGTGTQSIPMQQRSTVSESDRASSITASTSKSSPRSRRGSISREDRLPNPNPNPNLNPTRSETSTRSRRSGTGT